MPLEHKENKSTDGCRDTKGHQHLRDIDSREVKKGKARGGRVTLIRTKKSPPELSPIVPITLTGVNNDVLFSERQS